MNSVTKNKDRTQKVTVKQEKPEIYPLGHYVDDRVDLVQQVFSSLKSKTIQNLTPDFLKNVPIAELEEMCLNELLGISTKRLTSIINATKCPTDTESDSDVDDIVEHISLEEISSDSADEKEVKPRKLADKRKRKADTTGPQGKGKNAKEISVLELLELQARARAIRSQLALEPIAKIEVDSDEAETVEEEQPAPKKKSPVASVAEKPSKSSSSNGHLSNSKTNPKRIKLKRNFRKPTESNEEHEYKDGEKPAEKESPSSSKMAKGDENIRAKSPSPDVITILPSPETLCISDSSEEDTDPANEETPKSNGVVTRAEDSNSAELSQSEDHPPRGDENRTSDIEEGEILDKEEETEEIVENEQNSPQNNPEVTEAENPVVDTEKQTITEVIPAENETGKELNQEDQEEVTSCGEGNACDSNEDQHNDDVISLEHEELDEYNFDEGEKPMDLSRNDSKDNKCDAVSLKLPEQSFCESSRMSTEGNESIECIEIDDDDNDDTTETTSKDEFSSWNHRWLKSAKVTRILATSRLGNRVRDRIKQSKRAESSPVPSESENSSPKEDTLSKFEDGSMQQYREILERQKTNP